MNSFVSVNIVGFLISCSLMFCNRYMHSLPIEYHKFETLVNHLVESVLIWMVIFPKVRSVRLVGGSVQILFQFGIIMGGNYAFLNWLTILPAIFCFDDKFLM